MTFAAVSLLAAMTSANAVATVLNSKSATSAANYAEALEMVEKEAGEGKPLQQFVIGVITDDKKLSARYLDAARDKILKLAEKTDNPIAWYLLSMEKNDITMLVRAADGGNVQALNALGTVITQQALSLDRSDTNAVERLLKRSYGYFSKAAEARDPNGFINLGTCYLRGLGCPQDMSMAFTCFKAAADAGHPEGMDNMSACYQFGHGVEKNGELSLYWAMRGRAARGDKAAAKWLKDRK
ncbi:MAG: sel1 repeat family protein [Kiritimatiellae bacterium]|nr:sel1 repeat family protein [Kiritimatiellia bacterium]